MATASSRAVTFRPLRRYPSRPLRGPSRGTTVALPRWYSITVAVVLCGLTSASVVGVAAAVLAVFRPMVVGPAAVAGAALLFCAWRPWQGAPGAASREPTSGHRWTTGVAIAFIVVMTGLNVAHAAEHVVTDRDPGVYVVTARWLARHGNLVVTAREGPYATEHDVTFVELGFYDTRPDGKLVP